ncbi:MAG: hypothetical protein IJF27_05195 [Oscillospiraceae bacterium]|nr:hypothetical protein [Oscillospiraceae bacterium]
MDDSNAWLLDEKGRRYRENGKMREYEMIIHIDGHEIPQSELADYHRRKESQAGIVYNPPDIQKICPFNRSGIDPRCKGKVCAWWNEGCALLNRAPSREGLCPVSGGFAMRCTVQCVAYNNGCILAAADRSDTIKKEENEE